MRTINQGHRLDFPIIHRKIWDITKTMSLHCYANYHWEEFERYTPEIVVDSEIDVNHRPIANWGSNVSLGLNCLKIEDEEYIFNKNTKERVKDFVDNKISKLKVFLGEE